MAAAWDLDGFASSLTSLAPTSVRAYRSDLADLAVSTGPGIRLDEVDLEHLREWLWRATKRGDARSTIARRTAATEATTVVTPSA